MFTWSFSHHMPFYLRFPVFSVSFSKTLSNKQLLFSYYWLHEIIHLNMHFTVVTL
uniref:Uncharacterized protein n=1 Tax=Anguilla anguilla TaxID=7936 RepID=A0A0E9TXY5_ANGAN